MSVRFSNGSLKKNSMATAFQHPFHVRLYSDTGAPWLVRVQSLIFSMIAEGSMNVIASQGSKVHAEPISKAFRITAYIIPAPKSALRELPVNISGELITTLLVLPKLNKEED